jgi:hypothetical protein
MNVESTTVDDAVKVDKPRRRWLRYGLRSAFVLVTLVAVAATWLGSHVRRCHREAQAINQLLTSNNGITLDILYASPFDRNIGLQSRNQHRFGRSEAWTINTFQGGPTWLANLPGVDIFKTATFLQCGGAAGRPNRARFGRANDGRIHVIGREFESGVHDEEMRWIGQLTHLRHLSLTFSAVTNKGLAELKPLKRLQVLLLGATAVSDEGLSVLAELPELQELDLDSTDVTDKGIAALAACKRLKKLNISRTVVSDAAVERLQRQLPDCEIIGSD